VDDGERLRRPAQRDVQLAQVDERRAEHLVVPEQAVALLWI
jgi:hypothetical protein